MNEPTSASCQFPIRKTLVWTGVLIAYWAAFIRAESGVASFAFFGLSALAIADSLVGLRRMRLWTAALGAYSAGFMLVESVSTAIGLLAFWGFVVASSLLGLRKVLLWTGVLVVYSAVFAVFESGGAALVCFCLSVLVIAVLRTVVRPTVLALLCPITGAALWPVFYFARGFADTAYINTMDLLAGSLLGAILGAAVVAAIELGRWIVDWADERLPRRGGRKENNGWRLQFSLAQMFCLVLLLSLPLGWIAAKMREATRNRDAAAWLNGEGIFVGSRSPNWVEDLLHTRPIYNVSVSNVFVSDVTGFDDTDLADMLPHLKGLSSLRSLDLKGSSVSNAGLRHLSGMEGLESLDLEGTRVNDQGLPRLWSLTRLTRLDLKETTISDAGLEHLEGLRGLRSLDLSRTGITDAGLKRLGELTKLSSLSLDHTEISDAGIAYLRGLTNLHDLSLGGTRVTDAGLRHLEGLHKLRNLSLHGTDVSTQGIAKLREALPRWRRPSVYVGPYQYKAPL